ncbi:CbtA family protein [Halalkalicoccus ordinarius]|uniref:CbtA family protein n=1 Tax=Halalkalicoccus ordinarius TaxID=3116651 RepID=UPI00300EADC3
MIVDSFKRGIAAGIVAGLAYGSFLALVGNPLVEYLEHAGHGHGHEHGPAAVSELTAAVVSVGSGVLWGVLLGAAFGVAYYLFEPSLPGAGTTKAYVLAGAGFLTVSGAPWLALPPVAPGTEQALATDVRLVVYGVMMAFGATICVLSVGLYRYVRDEHDTSVAAGIAAVPFALCAIPIVLGPTTVSGGSGGLAIAFRWLVVLGQVALWTIIAAVYGGLDRRADGTTPSLDDLDDELTAGA